MNFEAIKAAGLYDEYVAYSKRDDENCALIYDKLVRSGKFPVGELAVMDMVMRTCSQPRFVLDRNLLHEHLGEVLAEKEALMARISADKDSLMSNEKFAGLLRDMGVDPPMKISPATGNETYAFAKSDPAFLDLAEHDDPAVQALVEARLGAKSTLEETRTKRFISISQLEWTPQVTSLGNPLMPMPIRYSAAHTHRFGGDWKLNCQNLRRGGKLRHSLEAPDGHKVMTVDSSQVEAREVVTFSGQDDVVEQFERGEDTYAHLATEIFGFPVNKKDHPDERFVGKQGRLGLGYQLWWPKFQSRVKTDSKNQTGKMIILSDQQALNAVTTFRRLNDKVCDAWNLLNTEGIGVLAHGGKFEFAACVFTKGEIALPNGLKLHYHDLRQEYDKKKGRTQWMFTYAGKPEGIYGGKIMENLMQSLAAVLTYGAAIRIQKRSY
jgi:DNA polymerase